MSVLELLNERMLFKKNVSAVLFRLWALNLVMYEYFGAAHPGCGHLFALGRLRARSSPLVWWVTITTHHNYIHKLAFLSQLKQSEDPEF
jgi:hypothetical protein